MTWIIRGFRNTVIRASQTENSPGDRVGVLNRIFGVAYHVRLLGKRIKRRSKLAHYTLKWLILGGLVVWIFA
jgi:beta-hydroxylase